ncbi:MAG: hypothetical protein AAF829_12930 [Pseudomonadota bacterium]
MLLIRSLLSWVLALGLIFVFLQATIHPLPNPPEGSVKLFDAPGQNIVFATMADRSGIALFEPAGRVAVAFSELFAALLLLVPWSRRFGAVISFFVLSGAVGFHLSPWLGREIPTGLEPGAATDGGALFMLAIAMLVVSILLAMIHPGKRAREAGRS